jgi:antitoxin PrlF
MDKILQAESTLTNRYQTTIPEAIRNSLHLNKHDKITYTIQADGKVLMSRATQDDPVLGEFLTLLADDIKNNPNHVRVISPQLVDRVKGLISKVEIDLDAPLDAKDD